MITNPYAVKPADVENAKQEVQRLEIIWRQQGSASPHKHALEEQGRALTEMALQIEDQERQLKSLRKRIHRQRLHIRDLTARLRLGRFWQAPYTPTVICLTGMIGTVLFAGYVGILVRPALGALVGLIGMCMTALALVLQHYRVELGIDTGRLIENNRNRLESAEKELSCLESDEQVATEAARQRFHQWQVDTARYDRLCSLHELARRHEAALNRYQALLEIVTSRRYQLPNANWRDMRSTVFESFLQEVFEFLGYVVQTTKASGDQGIDLILSRDGRRIGVQAKGYAESVGNHAVMEANAGKDYYHCHSCVVIANSDFTRLARELATEINCRLIGANEIPNLIMGNIRL